MLKIEKKNWQFYGVDESKIQSTVLEIKFIKRKSFKIKKLALKIYNLQACSKWCTAGTAWVVPDFSSKEGRG